MLITIAIVIQLCSQSLTAVIGDYPELNPKTCGLTRVSRQLDSECLRWRHKRSTTPAIKDGRNATEGETPWTVYIEKLTWCINEADDSKRTKFANTCSGSIIADKWILTAAHCIGPSPRPGWKAVDVTYSVYTGTNFSYIGFYEIYAKFTRNEITQAHYYQILADMNIKYYKVDQIFTHENYTGDHPGDMYFKQNFTRHFKLNVHDIALIKLKETIILGFRGNDFALENSICLPEENYREPINAFAMGSGYGIMGPNKNSFRFPVQMTSVRTSAQLNVSMLSSVVYFLHGGGQLCKGDSGGPIWQYVNGRAVIISVNSFGWSNNDTTCDNMLEKPLIGARVSAYIDWIVNITGLDVKHLTDTGHTPEFKDVHGELDGPIRMDLDLAWGHINLTIS